MSVQDQRPFLSIIVPFHNRKDKCSRLLETLGNVRAADDVELILVDDGSTDGTAEMLQDFAAGHECSVRIIERSNGGPGAARNSGLDVASGQFIWFVDSDDDIDLGAISIAKQAQSSGIDVIAWEFSHAHMRCPIPPGLHETGDDPAPTTAMETIVTKWFSRDFVARIAMRFPENCLFEATPLEAFILPLRIRTYLKSPFTAYAVNTTDESITRNAQYDPRFYDRLRTITLGMEYVCQARLSPDRKAEFDRAFIRLFLWYSIRLSKWPGASWLRAARVMRQFREEARRLEIRSNPWTLYPGRAASRAASRMLWALSSLLPSQRDYFARLHMKAWDRAIEWQRPNPPASGPPGEAARERSRPAQAGS